MLCASLLAAAKILRQARQGRFFNSSGGSSIHSEMRSYPVELRGYEFLLGEIHRWRQVWRELFRRDPANRLNSTKTIWLSATPSRRFNTTKQFTRYARGYGLL